MVLLCVFFLNAEEVGLDSLRLHDTFDGGNNSYLTIDRIVPLLKIFGFEGTFCAALLNQYHKRYG